MAKAPAQPSHVGSRVNRSSTRWAASLAIACILFGCSTRGCERSAPHASAETATPQAVHDDCPRFDKGRIVGRIEAGTIVEASGIVASHKNPGVLWLHNDSGHPEQLFALSSTAQVRAVFSLTAAECLDWEDLAIGPGPGAGPYLYIGDIGTNRTARSKVSVYRVAEPSIAADAGPVEAMLEDVSRIELVYPDGRGHDSEALLVDPLSGDLYLITKRARGPAEVFRAKASLRGDRSNLLEHVTTLQLASETGRGAHLITGGDISPDGGLVIMKTYQRAYLWRRKRGSSIAETLSTRPCAAPVSAEPQGEAIGFSADGDGYFTVSEGHSQPIYFFPRVGF